MENQCLGLAEAVGLKTVVKRIQVRAPWKWLPPGLWPLPLSAASSESDSLSPPWPRLLISTGRLSVAPSVAIRRRSSGSTFCVHIQSPGISADNFDIVVPPRHDRISGRNLIPTMGALHRVNLSLLSREAAKFSDLVSNLPRPIVAVLVGGNNGAYQLGPSEARDLGDKLAMLAKDGAGLLVTMSRRTGNINEETIRKSLLDFEAIVWDGSEPNPYYGYLGLADYILVTCDSVSMISEAISTGKPVYVLELPGGNNKFRSFHKDLVDQGITRKFEGKLEMWSYEPPNDTETVAAEIRRKLDLYTASQSGTD